MRLYVIPGSHPCAAVEAALRLKGLDYDRVDLPPVASRAVQRLRFGERTVPGLELDGERIVGSRRIMRRLDALAPEPPLVPADPGARERVEEAERWGEEQLQPLARRLLWAAARHRPEALASFAAGARLPVPAALQRALSPLLAPVAARLNGASDASAAADRPALRGALDHVDALIADGVIGGEPPNAADLQIASSVALLATVEDLGPELGDRPARRLAERLFPGYPGRVPAGALPGPSG